MRLVKPNYLAPVNDILRRKWDENMVWTDGESRMKHPEKLVFETLWHLHVARDRDRKTPCFLFPGVNWHTDVRDAAWDILHSSRVLALLTSMALAKVIRSYLLGFGVVSIEKMRLYSWVFVLGSLRQQMSRSLDQHGINWCDNRWATYEQGALCKGIFEWWWVHRFLRPAPDGSCCPNGR